MKKTEHNLTIEEEILILQKKNGNTSISIGEILQTLSEKGQLLMILFLSIPFCQPLQIPGMSVPFGLAIAFLGLKMTFGKYAWLPKSILAKTISGHSLQLITEKVLWLLKKMSRWIYPRLIWLCDHPALQIFNGLLISFLGILLALPLPAPFTNLMAAWSIFLLGLGLLKEDGLFILLGYFSSLLTFGFFIAMVFLIKYIF